MKTKTKAFILAAIMIAGGIGTGSYAVYCNNKMNSLVESELKYEDSNLALEDMFTKDENEVSIEGSTDRFDSAVIMSGEDLYKYLIDHEIEMLCIDGTWYSKDAKMFEIPESACNQEFFHSEKGSTLDFDLKDENDLMYTIMTKPYSDLKKYNVSKLLRFNKSYVIDKKYSEKYFLS